MSNKLKRNYYRVSIPLDLTDNKKEAGHCAIIEAESRTRKYFMPATWHANLVKITGNDYIFAVYRIHN